jgi:hypothetical protein
MGTWNVGKGPTPIPKGRWYIRRATNCLRSKLERKPGRGPSVKEGCAEG